MTVSKSVKTLAAAMAAVIVVAVCIGCNDSGSKINGSENAAANSGNNRDGDAETDSKIKHVNTVQGKCTNVLSNGKTYTQKYQADVYTTADSVRVTANIIYFCGTPFETECTIKDKTINIQIKNVSPNPDIVAACSCDYPFEFQFEKKGDIDYDYVIELVRSISEQPEIILDGKISAK